MSIARVMATLAGVLVALAVGFAAGRFTAAPPRFEPAVAGADEDPLAAGWAEMIRAQEAALALLLAHEFAGDEQERTEAYRGVLYGLAGSIENQVFLDPDRPRFLRMPDLGSKSGLENPDNSYYITRIRDDATYRIRGTRGSAATMHLQIVMGQPGVRDAGSSTNVSLLSGDDMHLAPDGSFEVQVGGEDPGPDTDWLPTTEGAETVLVRWSHADWNDELPGSPTLRWQRGRPSSAAARSGREPSPATGLSRSAAPRRTWRTPSRLPAAKPCPAQCRSVTCSA